MLQLVRSAENARAKWGAHLYYYYHHLLFMMPLGVCIPETPAGFYRMSEIRSLAFQRDHAYIDMPFPRHWTSEGRELLRDRLLSIRSEVASSRYVVVKDTDTDEIISQAEWHYYSPESVGDVMDLEFVEGSEEEKNYARNMIGSFQAGRREAIKEKNDHLMCKFAPSEAKPLSFL
ncbi:hypothetical protein OCU04_009968 [Sclerotinia nivalis]|uniref:Uncharacterized protein n=1 Tax=Sclerotinia nivalis TaxID=352851 RepID=A0A9X0DGK1_9HELO|nr:hypothetical protein OCU04_009968 [Sclerotinia nivalis]